MRLLRYGPPGREKPGLLDPMGTVRDLSMFVDDIANKVLMPPSIAMIASIDPHSLPAVTDPGRIGPCVGKVGKYIGVGLNYADHAAEIGKGVPAEPIIFTKSSSAIGGPNDDIVMPRGSQKTDWEVELGVVIGSPAKYIGEKDALDYVVGYCALNDVSERDFQLRREGQWIKGKSCDTFGPLGPWLVTKDEVTDIDDLDLFCEIDGVRRQSGNTSQMFFKVPFLVSYISQFFTLLPGDIIATGTPAGIGSGLKPPTYLQPGQIVRCGVAGLGELQQRVVQG